MRVLLVLMLAVVLVAIAFAGVWNLVLDRTVTSTGAVYLSDNIYAAKNDSTHVAIATSDSLKIYYWLMVKKTNLSAPVAYGATPLDSIGPASGVYVKSWKGLTSAYYAYAVRCSVCVLDATSPRVRLQMWETGD